MYNTINNKAGLLCEQDAIDDLSEVIRSYIDQGEGRRFSAASVCVCLVSGSGYDNLRRKICEVLPQGWRLSRLCRNGFHNEHGQSGFDVIVSNTASVAAAA